MPADGRGLGRVAPGLLLALAIAQAVVWVMGLPPGAGAAGFAWRAALLGGLQLAAAGLAWRRDDRATLLIVLLSAVVFRAAAWAWPPDLSSDLFRYVWDGRVQLDGHSPYAFPPGHPSLAHLRDAAIFAHINRPEAVTVYPPGAQLAFLLLQTAGLGSVAGVKTVAVAADLTALFIVASVLRRKRLPIGRLVLYAWSPLVISEVAVSGHLDALVLPLMLVALVRADAREPLLAGSLLGAATLLKLYPVLLLFSLPRGGRWRAVGACAAVIAGGYALYAATAGAGVLGFLPRYLGSAEDFNPALRGFLQDALPFAGRAARPIAMSVCGIGLALAAVAIARWEDGDTLARARALGLAFVLLLPTAVHPWYALWLVPLLALAPPTAVAAAGVWIACTLPLSYLKYGSRGGVMPGWVSLVEWLPPVVLLAAGWARGRPRGAGKVSA